MPPRSTSSIETNVKHKGCSDEDIFDVVYFIYDSDDMATQFNVADPTVYMYASRYALYENTNVNVRTPYDRLWVSIEKYGNCTIVLSYVSTFVIARPALEYSCEDRYTLCKFLVSSIKSTITL